VVEYTQAKIESSKAWYASFEKKVLGAYEKTGLVYNADENPFIN